MNYIHSRIATHRWAIVGVLWAALWAPGDSVRAGELILKYSSYALEGYYRVDWGHAITVDANGNVGFTGAFDNPNPPDLGVTLYRSDLLSNTVYHSKFYSGIANAGSTIGQAVALDRDTNMWVTGFTSGTNLYVTPNAYQPSRAISTNTTTLYNGFVMKIDPRLPAGNGSVLYSTYLGGSGAHNAAEYLRAIAVDKDDNAYVVGRTCSANFPVTSNAYQTTKGDAGANYDAAFAKFDSTGGCVFASFLGGSEYDQASGIAVDDSGNIYIVGTTASANFPVTAGACQKNKSSGASTDMFLTKFDSTGTNILYSTFLGGTGDEGAGDVGRLALDNAGIVWIMGRSTTGFPVKNAYKSALSGGYDAVFAKIDTSLTGADSLLCSSYFGGSNHETYNGDGSFDGGIAVDGDGNVYLTATTYSTDLPTKLGFQEGVNLSNTTPDAFVASFSPDGAFLRYSSYLGGTGEDRGEAIAADRDGAVYLTGQTKSYDFPCTPDAARTLFDGWGDVFVAKIVYKLSGTMILIR
ncbi:MAG: SBBP repeat-containing protein [Kiritimatiellae bacterium]|nr:SBBP repeat-containing protein [Kiritimatiellia bacterium]